MLWGHPFLPRFILFSPIFVTCGAALPSLPVSPGLQPSPASSIFPMVITSHSDVSLMSPRRTPNAGPRPCPGAVPCGPGPRRGCAWPVRAVSCCRLILESVCPCAGSLGAFLRTATRAMSRPASAQHRLAGWAPLSTRGDVHLPEPRAGMGRASPRWDVGELPAPTSNFSAWWQSTLPSQPLPKHLRVLLSKLAPKSTRSPLIEGESLRTWLGREAPPTLRGCCDALSGWTDPS